MFLTQEMFIHQFSQGYYASAYIIIINFLFCNRNTSSYKKICNIPILTPGMCWIRFCINCKCMVIIVGAEPCEFK
jgi:hypothetical protein